jgi:hypothetical protein
MQGAQRHTLRGTIRGVHLHSSELAAADAPAQGVSADAECCGSLGDGQCSVLLNVLHSVSRVGTTLCRDAQQRRYDCATVRVLSRTRDSFHARKSESLEQPNSSAIRSARRPFLTEVAAVGQPDIRKQATINVAIAGHDMVSGRRESHPPALSELGVSLATHPAPIVQPSGRTSFQ